MHVLPELTYAFDALEPHIDAKTMEIHYTKHHQSYVDNLNKHLEPYQDLARRSIYELLADIEKVPTEIRTAVRNHGGGHANHTMFWVVMGPGKGGKPTGELARALDSVFGSFDNFKERMSNAALAQFGSGWAWLCIAREGGLTIETSANQDSPLMHQRKPILGIDVWEHAYYLKHQNRRADYIKDWWNTINWDNVGKWFQGNNWWESK